MIGASNTNRLCETLCPIEVDTTHLVMPSWKPTLLVQDLVQLVVEITHTEHIIFIQVLDSAAFFVGPCSRGQLVDKDNRDVCGLSAVDPCPNSELWIRVCTMLKDAAALSWLGLVKQVLSSKDSCWLANGAVVTSSPGEGRMALQTSGSVLPRIRISSSSRATIRGAAAAVNSS